MPHPGAPHLPLLPLPMTATSYHGNHMKLQGDSLGLHIVPVWWTFSTPWKDEENLSISLTCPFHPGLLFKTMEHTGMSYIRYHQIENSTGSPAKLLHWMMAQAGLSPVVLLLSLVSLQYFGLSHVNWSLVLLPSVPTAWGFPKPLTVRGIWAI